MESGELRASAAFAAVVTAPGFAVGVRLAGEKLAEIRFLPPQPAQAPHEPLAQEAVRQLEAYLHQPTFQFDLPLLAQGTAFRQRVWQAIAAIPLGQTRSYGALARDLASSARAVGQACGDNPFPLIVPCHRVVSASGALGGFAHSQAPWLLHTKTWLLAHEGAR